MTKLAIGLIGGIATGKSLAAQYFKALGIEVIDADQIAHDLVAPGQPQLQAIVNHFGTEILTPTGTLNRQALRDIIFAKPQERLWLENLLHPLIRQRIDHAIDQAQGPYCIVAIPLLKKREDYPKLQKILALTVSPAIQIQRVLTREHMTLELAEKIIATQPSLTDTLALADYSIDNNTSPDHLKEKIQDFDQTIRAI